MGNSDDQVVKIHSSDDSEQVPNTECLSIPADPKLIAEGWERRHLADPNRARESVELYTSMGFEVLEKELTPDDLDPNCTDCASELCESYVVIYTRKKAAKS